MDHITFTPGLLPNDPNKARLYMRAFKKPEAVAPTSVTAYNGTPNLGMLGNDAYGDCVEAMIGHNVDELTHFGSGTSYVVSTTEALGAYTTITGFNPKDPSTDQGTILQDGLGFLRSTGFGGNKAEAFAQLDVTNFDEVKLAVAEFGSVSIGFNFPASAMTQFNKGTAWTPLKSDGGIEGGHAVLICGYDASWLYLYTWGTLFKMSYPFWTKYVSEAWTTISSMWFNEASGLDPEGIDKYALGAQYAALTGQPNPFPGGPTPPPPPPVTDPADTTLNAAIKTWQTAKGL